MTPPSAFLVAPTVQLNALPDLDRDVLRRFCTEHVRGIDAESDRRWRRMWSQLMRATPGECFELVRAEPRDLPFHRLHRVVLERLFNAQERFHPIDALHTWLKVRTHFVTWGIGPRGNFVPIPRSTAFDECSEDDMRDFHRRMVDYLHDPECQRHLWRHLPAPQRAEMVESVLAKPEEEGQRP